MVAGDQARGFTQPDGRLRRPCARRRPIAHATIGGAEEHLRRQADDGDVEHHLHRRAARATVVTGAMSPKPTVASTVTVKYNAAVRSRGCGKLAGSLAAMRKSDAANTTTSSGVPTVLEAYRTATEDEGKGAVMFGDEMIDEASRKMATKFVSRGERAGLTRSAAG